MEGFQERFSQLIKSGCSYEKAYFDAEEEHKTLFKKYRYKSYESFRNVRRNYIFKGLER